MEMIDYSQGEKQSGLYSKESRSSETVRVGAPRAGARRTAARPANPPRATLAATVDRRPAAATDLELALL